MSQQLDLPAALDRSWIEQRLSAANVQAAHRLHVFDEIDSTNRYLLDWSDIGTLNGRVCMAEHQLAGRGRRGKSWRDSPRGSLMLSIAWVMDSAAKLIGLSLCVGVAIVRVMRALGIGDIQLKWPNDVLWNEQKLGGILVETSLESGNTWRVVVGIGINVHLNKEHAGHIDQPWIDLSGVAQQTGGPLSDRNHLAVALVIELSAVLEQFVRTGFAAYRDEWLQAHVLQNQPVSVRSEKQFIQGIVIGVDESGALQIRKADGEVVSVVSGEIGVSPA